MRSIYSNRLEKYHLLKIYKLYNGKEKKLLPSSKWLLNLSKFIVLDLVEYIEFLALKCFQN